MEKFCTKARPLKPLVVVAVVFIRTVACIRGQLAFDHFGMDIARVIIEGGF